MNDIQNNIIISKLVNKIRDKSNNIIGYELIDQQGRKAQFKSNDLKNMIRAGQIKVIGLTLTKDGRLVNGATDKIVTKTSVKKQATAKPINTLPIEGVIAAYRVDVYKKSLYIYISSSINDGRMNFSITIENKLQQKNKQRYYSKNLNNLLGYFIKHNTSYLCNWYVWFDGYDNINDRDTKAFCEYIDNSEQPGLFTALYSIATKNHCEIDRSDLDDFKYNLIIKTRLAMNILVQSEYNDETVDSLIKSLNLIQFDYDRTLSQGSNIQDGLIDFIRKVRELDIDIRPQVLKTCWNKTKAFDDKYSIYTINLELDSCCTYNWVAISLEGFIRGLSESGIWDTLLDMAEDCGDSEDEIVQNIAGYVASFQIIECNVGSIADKVLSRFPYEGELDKYGINKDIIEKIYWQYRK